MVVILASLSLPLCIAAVVVIPLLSTIVVGFWPSSLSLCVAVVVVASSSQDGHRHKMVVVMALMSLSLCVAVVVVIPLLSTIVFVGLLDVGCHHSLFVAVVVVARWSSSWRCCRCLFVLLLSSSCSSTIVFVGLLDFGHHRHLFVAVVTPLLFLLLLLLLSVLGHHHCRSGLARFQLIFLYSYIYFAFYFMF